MQTRLSTTQKKLQKPLIHELKVITRESDNTIYPIRMSSLIIGFYSTLKSAEADMRAIATDDYIPFNNASYDNVLFHHFVIQARALDKAQLLYDGYERRVYDNQGNFLGVCLPDNEPFSGKRPDECKYKEGEFVEFDDHGTLRLGIISILPLTPEIARKLPLGYADQTDNVYCVEFSNMDRSHSHLPECDLFKPQYCNHYNSTRIELLREYKYLRLPHESYGTNSKGRLIKYEGCCPNTGIKYRLRISDCMSDSFKKPYVIIHDETHDIRVYISLETFRILGGRPKKLDSSELERSLKIIKENHEFLISRFHVVRGTVGERE
ncbi:MAG: hypothetical protein HQM09_22860 [Candidatus Riflebacteria bacterium]|nr:hypothetical protein [Candidatus Riflebacteria bacterium]